MSTKVLKGLESGEKTPEIAVAVRLYFLTTIVTRRAILSMTTENELTTRRMTVLVQSNRNE
jgi:hypothetical protein